MSEDTTNLEWNQAERLSLEPIAQVGAQQVLALALEAEITIYSDQYGAGKTSTGHRTVVRAMGIIVPGRSRPVPGPWSRRRRRAFPRRRLPG